jgi:hypothetical protein
VFEIAQIGAIQCLAKKFLTTVNPMQFDGVLFGYKTRRHVTNYICILSSDLQWRQTLNGKFQTHEKSYISHQQCSIVVPMDALLNKADSPKKGETVGQVAGRRGTILLLYVKKIGWIGRRTTTLWDGWLAGHVRKSRCLLLRHWNERFFWQAELICHGCRRLLRRIYGARWAKNN